MKTNILFLILTCILICGCIPKEKEISPRNTSNKSMPIIGGSDTITSIKIEKWKTVSDKDTVIYETPECKLWYTQNLPNEYKNKLICMWTEHAIYWEEVKVINVFVVNPTSTPLTYGRSWFLYQQNGEKWDEPNRKITGFSWEDDAFSKNKAPLLYCFRFPVGKYYHLPKGKYQICKSFYLDSKKIKLNAEFEIK